MSDKSFGLAKTQTGVFERLASRDECGVLIKPLEYIVPISSFGLISCFLWRFICLEGNIRWVNQGSKFDTIEKNVNPAD